MKSILIALGVLIVINLLAVGAGVGWLAATDRLSQQRVRSAISIFEPTLAQEAALAAEAQALAEQAAEAQAHAIRLAEVAEGPMTLEERLADSRKFDQVTTQRIERLKREREDILRQIAAAKALVETQREAIAAREVAFEEKVASYAQQREDEDFKQAVRMLEQLKPRQAKEMFQDLLAMGDMETAVAYLSTMNQRKAGAVLREFKEEQEIAQARLLIEALRDQGVFPTREDVS